MSKINVFYLLNEEGRKEDILNGKDGQYLQHLVIESTPELLRIATVDPDGSIYLGLNVEARVATAADLNGEEFIESERFKQYEYDFEGKKFIIDNCSIVDYVLEKVGNEYDVLEVLDSIEYPRTFTEESIIEEIEKFEKKQKKLARIEKNLKKQLEEINAAQKQKEVVFEEEKKNWIEINGSEHLKLSAKLNYENIELYPTERAKAEYPEYILHLEDIHEEVLKDTISANPSFESLKEVADLIDKGIDAKVINVDHFEKDDDDQIVNICKKEAIIIVGYLGKFMLIKNIK